MSKKTTRRKFFERTLGVSAAAAVAGSLSFEHQTLLAQTGEQVEGRLAPAASIRSPER